MSNWQKCGPYCYLKIINGTLATIRKKNKKKISTALRKHFLILDEDTTFDLKNVENDKKERIIISTGEYEVIDDYINPGVLVIKGTKHGQSYSQWMSVDGFFTYVLNDWISSIEIEKEGFFKSKNRGAKSRVLTN